MHPQSRSAPFVRSLVSAGLLALLTVLAGQAQAATYNAIDLTGSHGGAAIVGISGGVEVAQGGVNSWGHATSYQGSSDTWVDLGPSGPQQISGALGISGTIGAGGQIVGFVDSLNWPYHEEAAVWSSRSTNYTNLNNPTISIISAAWGTDGNYQVGSGQMSSNYMALMWNGSPNSCVNLNPAGFTSSTAYGVYGGFQVGSGSGTPTGGRTHALLWHGSATQFWDVNPSGKSSSEILGMAGMLGFGDADSHAMLWNLQTDGTFTTQDLQPAGFSITEVKASNGSQYVGDGTGTNTGYAWHAMLWTGVGTNYIDLNQFLPTNATYVRSYATGIDANGDVAGWAVDSLGFSHPILWQAAPEPATLALLAIGGIGALLRRRK